MEVLPQSTAMWIAFALLLIGGGHAAIAFATGKMPTTLGAPVERHASPELYWLLTAMAGLTGLVGLFGIIIKLAG
jgi:hypothetical protein